MAEKVASLYAEIGADTRGLKRGLSETKGSLDKAHKGMMDFKTVAIASFAAIGGAILAAKKVWDFGKEGAQLEFVRGKFDNLTESIGTTSDALLSDLKKATRGTVSDANLVASATDFMSLGLAKSHDQVVRLTRVAGALGMNMNQLVLTLTNQTTMRFDALGVSVDGFDDRLEALKKTGMDTNAAFTEAFLQQAEEQILRVGDIADTTAGQIMMMEAEFANLSDTAKVSLAPAMGTLASEISRVIQENRDLNATLPEQDSWFVKLIKSVTGYEKSQMAAAVADGKAYTAKNPLVRLTGEQTTAIDGNSDAYDKNTGLVDDNTEAIKENERQQGILEGRLDKLRLLIDGPIGDAFDDFSERNVDLTMKAEGLRAKILELEQREYLTNEQKEELAGLKTDLDEVSGAMTANANAHDEATSRILLNLLEQQLAIGGWTNEEFMFLQEVANRWGLIDDKTLEATQGMQRALYEFSQSKDVKDAADALDTIKAKALGIPTKINIDVKVRYSEGGGIGGGAPSGDKKPRQLGGHVGKGMPYLVGELGPELFVPNQSGQVVNNWNLTANYAMRDRESLAMDVKMLSALYG